MIDWTEDNRLQENPWLSLFSLFTPLPDRRASSERHRSKQERGGSNMCAASCTVGNICYSGLQKGRQVTIVVPVHSTDSLRSGSRKQSGDGLFLSPVFMTCCMGSVFCPKVAFLGQHQDQVEQRSQSRRKRSKAVANTTWANWAWVNAREPSS